MAKVRRRSAPRRSFADLLEYLDHRLGGHVGGGPEFQFWCPFCIDREGSESDQRKLWCNMAKGVTHCFRCNYGSRDWLRFFRDLNGGGLRFEELALLRSETTAPTTAVTVAVQQILTRPEEVAATLQPLPVPAEMQRLAPHCRAKTKPLALRRAFRYLRTRGVRRRAIAQFDIGFCVGGRYAQRLIFPVYQHGHVVYFTNRYCGEHPCKTLNPKNQEGYYTKNHCLLNYDNVVGCARIGVVEGPFDALAFPHAVGLMGKTISAAQVALVAALVPLGLHEVIVCLDADAYADAVAVYHALAGRVPSVRVLPLEWGDPSARADELPALLAHTTTPSLSSMLAHRPRPQRAKRVDT